MPDTSQAIKVRKCQRRFDKILEDMHLTKEEVLGKRRTRAAFERRRIVACILYDENFSLPVIGAVMKRDHSTILNQVNQNLRRRKIEYGKKYYHGEKDNA